MPKTKEKLIEQIVRAQLDSYDEDNKNHLILGLQLGVLKPLSASSLSELKAEWRFYYE